MAYTVLLLVGTMSHGISKLNDLIRHYEERAMDGDIIRLAQIARAHGHHATVRRGYVTVYIRGLTRDNAEFYGMFDVTTKPQLMRVLGY